MEISKPDYTYLWSSGGSTVAPSNVKVQTGWTAEVPPFQWENWSQNRQDQAIAHVLQHGISVWDAVTEYQASKSYVTGSNGKIYVALQTNTNQNPVTDTSEVYWADIFKSGSIIISTVGVSSWTVPSILKLGIKSAYVTVVAGGGGGARGATPAGGGGGGVAEKLADLTGLTSVSVTVGAGGAGGASSETVGSNGNPSSFGSFCSATGGNGGGISIATTSTGGVGVGGDFNYTRGYGQVAFVTAGGATIGGAGGGTSSPAGTAGTGTPLTRGDGGGGRVSTAGDPGASGIVIIRW